MEDGEISKKSLRKKRSEQYKKMPLRKEYYDFRNVKTERNIHTSDGRHLEAYDSIAITAKILGEIGCCYDKSGKRYFTYRNNLYVGNIINREIVSIFERFNDVNIPNTPNTLNTESTVNSNYLLFTYDGDSTAKFMQVKPSITYSGSEWSLNVRAKAARKLAIVKYFVDCREYASYLYEYSKYGSRNDIPQPNLPGCLIGDNKRLLSAELIALVNNNICTLVSEIEQVYAEFQTCQFALASILLLLDEFEKLM
jgi:hypothetical protein